MRYKDYLQMDARSTSNKSLNMQKLLMHYEPLYKVGRNRRLAMKTNKFFKKEYPDITYTPINLKMQAANRSFQ